MIITSIQITSKATSLLLSRAFFVVANFLLIPLNYRDSSNTGLSQSEESVIDEGQSSDFPSSAESRFDNSNFPDGRGPPFPPSRIERVDITFKYFIWPKRGVLGIISIFYQLCLNIVSTLMRRFSNVNNLAAQILYFSRHANFWALLNYVTQL